ncbi:MAG TPA: thiamine pyrophosphate-binding protein [Nitrospirales bacterium]|nr:thiamine pyrophosphate-binding protein [Nitrospirales bacterium]
MSEPTIGSLLLDRLYKLGVKHIFGIPGDYVLSLYKLIEHSPIMHVGTTREDSAGYAADAYARINGIGAACVTYCVGGLNVVNAIACAYAERSPVVLLSGSPGMSERVRNPLLHHMVRDFTTQKEVFEHITVASCVLDDPVTAERELDRALHALMRYKRPIYLEVPRDLVHAPIETPVRARPPIEERTDPAALAEAIAEVREMLAAVERPVLLVGAEVHRFQLQDEVARLAERMNIPVASTLLGKSVIREDHPLFVGVYGALIGHDDVQKFVNEADCLVMLGSILTDLEDLGMDSPLMRAGRTIHATADAITIKHHRYETVWFEDFLRALIAAPMPVFPGRALPSYVLAPPKPTKPTDPATLAGVFSHLETLLDENMLVIADIGESLFAGADLRVHRRSEFMSPAYYTSMGFAVPAAVGASFADPSLRPIVLVGDGAFQMTGTELSTCVRYGHSPIVLVLNNRGYSTEREILEGPFNDLPEWRYDKVCDFVGGGVGHRVTTHGELVKALKTAIADRKQLHVLNIVLDPADRSPAMMRLARRLAKRLATDPGSSEPPTDSL